MQTDRAQGSACENKEPRDCDITTERPVVGRVLVPSRDPSEPPHSSAFCFPEKPGICPLTDGIASESPLCRSSCTGDKECAGDQKCCESGCGRTCQAPERGNRAAGAGLPSLQHGAVTPVSIHWSYLAPLVNPPQERVHASGCGQGGRGAAGDLPTPAPGATCAPGVSREHRGCSAPRGQEPRLKHGGAGCKVWSLPLSSRSTGFVHLWVRICSC